MISWPARVYDYATEPSPAIRSFPELAASELAFGGGAQSTADARGRETVVDIAPPLAEPRSSGGTSALNRQSRCPLRAFCEFRLGARPLEPVAYGVPGRLQGIVAHRALELLLQDLPAQGDLVRTTARDDAVERCVEQALVELFRDARHSLSAAVRARAGGAKRRGSRICSATTPSARVSSRGGRATRVAELGAWELRARVDRLDRLDDGSVAIIDYKTGNAASSADWFRERLRDTQAAFVRSARGGGGVGSRSRSHERGQVGLRRRLATGGGFPGTVGRSS